ncbi:MAG: LolA family protein, partial [Thermodesulfobacteriota bacterium]
WVYEKPERQHIISDGRHLWIFKPDENQVTVGDAPTLFGDGRGASFFADMKSLRTDFTATLAPEQKQGFHVLRLEPKKKTLDIAMIDMVVDAATFDVTSIETINAYGDKTRLEFSNRRFNQPAPDTIFTFDIPVDADVIQLNSENDG